MSFRWTIPIMSFLLLGFCLSGEATAESKPSYTRTVENYQLPK